MESKVYKVSWTQVMENLKFQTENIRFIWSEIGNIDGFLAGNYVSLGISITPFMMVCIPTQFLSQVQLFVTPWTVACQAPLSMGFPKQDYWNELPFPIPGNHPNPEIDSVSFASPALAGRFFTTCATWEACL